MKKTRKLILNENKVEFEQFQHSPAYKKIKKPTCLTAKCDVGVFRNLLTQAGSFLHVSENPIGTLYQTRVSYFILVCFKGNREIQRACQCLYYNNCITSHHTDHESCQSHRTNTLCTSCRNTNAAPTVKPVLLKLCLCYQTIDVF